MRKRRDDPCGFFVRDAASGAPEQLTGAKHGLEVGRLSEIERIVVPRVEHVGLGERGGKLEKNGDGSCKGTRAIVIATHRTYLE